MRVKRAKETKHIDWSEYFYYDETSASCLRWAKDRYGGKQYKVLRVSEGDSVGTKQKNGYWATHMILGGFKIHRIIWELFYGRIPDDKIIDHIDGDSYNNKIENLRLVSERENNMNTKQYKNNTSGTVGVYFDIKTDRKGIERSYYKASWIDMDGKQKTKAYNIDKFGKEEAFKLASDYRIKMIEELNLQGVYYSKRHGLNKR